MVVRPLVMRKFVPLLVSLAAVPGLFAQEGRTVLRGHVRPGIVAANDQGRVDATLVLRQITVTLQQTAAQEAELANLIASQQDPASPLFHQWLTPEEFGSRFGLPDTEIAQVRSWLESQKLTVDSVGRGRTTITFTGAVRDVERALSAEIHRYRVNGETHFANAGEPTVPVSMGRFIRAFHGLDDFHFQPRAIKAATPVVMGSHYTSVSTGNHFLAPEDVATIFDIAPLYNSGITGKGQKIVVVGQTRINLSDIQQFRTYFNLPTNDPTLLLVPNSVDPGISNADLGEADLDVEWAGAIARDAAVTYVYSNDVEKSLMYAIDNNIAPVISMSYGLCEQLSGNAELTTLNSYGQQASAQGISWIAASGDNGANDCYGESSRPPSGLSVDSPASVPTVTAIGGTTLTEAGGNYWSAINSPNHASALSYIPENVWNDSVADGSPSSGGGGASIFYTKPAWQSGAGVPADDHRYVPDISLPASADHDAYLVYSAGGLVAFGGTSVGAPVFSGIAGLLNQYLQGFPHPTVAGSLNKQLYRLAATSPNAFHDITVGDNIVAACAAGRVCTPAQVGYSAGPGYDEATGLGSVDAFNLVTAWPQAASAAKLSAAVQVVSSLSSLSPSDSTVLTASVTGSGSAAPTGTVTFFTGGSPLGSMDVGGSGLTVTAAKLSGGQQEASLPSGATVPVISPQVTAVYNGDSVYLDGAKGSITITIQAPGALVLSGITSAASFQRAYAPGMVVALFGANLAASTPDPAPSPLPTQMAGTSVTINGIPAPLYYVSPTQINLQIPWEIPKSSTAIVKVSAGAQTATSQVPISKNAPEIFGDTNNLLVPYQTTRRGQTVFLFATGEGLFTTPSVTTGAVPEGGTLSTASSNVLVRVGGVAAETTFVGEPAWSIGVSQVNFTIPANAPLGSQPVVMVVGGVVSAPVYITVAP